MPRSLLREERSACGVGRGYDGRNIGIGRLGFTEPVSEERVEEGCHAWYVSNVGQEILQID